MSLQEIMNDGSKVKKISVGDIRINGRNFYDLAEIEELADSIKRRGQLENASVFYDESQDDGRHYTLIRGNRRYNAITLLYEREEGDGLIECKILDKPIDDIDERGLIIEDNAQREKSLEERMQEVQYGIDLYNREKELGNIPSGVKCRDFIGKRIGLSGRHVQNILSKL